MQDDLKQQKLFRESAVKNLNIQQEITTTLKVVSPSAWMWMILVLIILAGLIVWAICGTITMYVSASGILLPEEQLQQVEKFINENLKDSQDKMLSLKDLLDKKTELYHKHYLTRIELEKAKEDYLLAKNELFSELNGGYIANRNTLFHSGLVNKGKALDALVFIDHMNGKKITTGMQAYLLPSRASPYEYRYIKGKVMSVSAYPASKQEVYSYLGNRSLIDEFFAEGAPFVAKIHLEKSAMTQGDLAGTVVSVKIINRVSSPWKFFISPLLHVFNGGEGQGEEV